MSSKSGYEYRYRVLVAPKENERKRRAYILSVRTDFKLKPIGVEEILMDTEGFGNRMTVDDEDIPRNLVPKLFSMLSGKNELDSLIRTRLSLYCMPDADIRALAQMAFDAFCDPRHDSFHTVPVRVFVDVYTVQLEGEPLDATIERSIKPEFLIPLQMRWSSNGPTNNLQRYLEGLPVLTVGDEENDLHGYLLNLPVVRVRDEVADDDMDSCPICLNEANIGDKYGFHEKHSVVRKDGLGLMEVCPICLREPIVGAKIASLPCKHAFHDHCIFRWLLKSQYCPLCRAEIHKLDCKRFLQ